MNRPGWRVHAAWSNPDNSSAGPSVGAPLEPPGAPRVPDPLTTTSRHHPRGGSNNSAVDKTVPDERTQTMKETFTLNNGITMPALGFGVFQSPPEESAAAVLA